MADQIRIDVPISDGNPASWPVFRPSVESYMTHRNRASLLTGLPVEGLDEARANREERELRGALFPSMRGESTKVAMFMQTDENMAAFSSAWGYLCDFYEPGSPNRLYNLVSELLTLNLGEGGNLETRLVNFEWVLRDLRLLKCDVIEKLASVVLARPLPESLSAVVMQAQMTDQFRMRALMSLSRKYSEASAM